MSDILLSHARETIETAKRLAEKLDDEGMSVCWDREIHAGNNYRIVIEEQLDSASCVVILWSVDPIVLQFSETLGKFYDQHLNVRQEARLQGRHSRVRYRDAAAGALKNAA